jgi:PAS domain S-box-containing protein
MAMQDSSSKKLDFKKKYELLRSILDSSSDYSIIATDLKGTVLTWSEGARRTYRYEASEVISKINFFDLHESEYAKTGQHQAKMDEVRKSGQWSGELKRVEKDGGLSTAFVTINLRYDE